MSNQFEKVPIQEKMIRETKDHLHLKTELMISQVRITWEIENFYIFFKSGAAFNSETIYSKKHKDLEWQIRVEILNETKNCKTTEKEISTRYLSLYVDNIRSPKNILAIKSTCTVLNSLDIVIIDKAADMKTTLDFGMFGWDRLIKLEDLIFQVPEILYPNCILRIVIDIDLQVTNSIPTQQNLTVEIPDPIKCVCDFKHLFEKQELSDVTLQIDDQSIPVHKVLLAGRSSVFFKIFSQNPNLSILEIKDIDFLVLREVIRFIYTGSVLNLETSETVIDLLAAANKYKIENLKLLSEKTLCETLSQENAGVFLLLAYENEAEYLKKHVMSFIRTNVKELMTTQKFQSLMETNPKILSEIFKDVLQF